MLSNKTSSAQEKYLLNHNIFVLSPTEKLSYKELYSKFFNDLNLYNSTEGLIKRILNKSENNEISVTATFPKEINEEQRKKLLQKLENKTGKKVVLDIKIDDSIIGGGIVRINDDVIDGSIKRQMENIKNTF